MADFSEIIWNADGGAIVRTCCAFWQKKRTNYYIEEFADLLRKQFAG